LAKQKLEEMREMIPLETETIQPAQKHPRGFNLIIGLKK